MGLRSRQRRLAGVKHEDSFDVETSKHRTQSLEEHVDASRRELDDRNLAWTNAVASMGLMLTLYEFGLWYSTVTVAQFAPSNPTVCLGFKLLAAVSNITTRSYVQTGSSRMFGLGVVSAVAYAALWASMGPVFGLKFTLMQVSPVPLVYALVSHLVMKFIGGNTKAEVARAKQLEKLEKAYNQSK